MKSKLVSRVLAVAAAALVGLGAGPVRGQGSIPVGAAENARLWFVELEGAPTADGNSLASVQAEKDAFRRAAVAAGVRYTERRTFDVLFTGFSVEVDPADRMKLAQLPGVKAIYPVVEIGVPRPEPRAGASPNLVAAITMTGAKAAQDDLGLTGSGVKVGSIDTGID